MPRASQGKRRRQACAFITKSGAARGEQKHRTALADALEDLGLQLGPGEIFRSVERGFVITKSVFEVVALSRNGRIIQMIVDVLQATEALPATVVLEIRRTDVARKSDLSDFVAYAEFGHGMDREAEVDAPANVAIAVFRYTIVVQVNVKWKTIGVAPARNEKVTLPMQRVVVLGGEAILRAGNNVIPPL